MPKTLRLLPCLVALACVAGTVHAQTRAAPAGTPTQRSYLPGTTEGYVGLNVGQSKYDLRSGTGGFGSDDSATGFKIYTGGYFHPNLGVEVGYLHMGSADRVGGRTRAQGVNLSLVGRAPLTEQYDVFGKVGTTYGRTRTNGYEGFGVATGKDDGFGLSYGLGVRWNFTPQWSAVLEWERHRFHFADGRSNVNLTSLGVQYRF